MIVVAYAVGAVRISNKGALVQQANSVESLCNVDILCLDKTGTLTTNHLKLDQILPYDQENNHFTEESIHRLLGVFSRSTSAVNRTTEAIHEACQGQDRGIRDEIPFSSHNPALTQLLWSHPSEAAEPLSDYNAGHDFMGILDTSSLANSTD